MITDKIFEEVVKVGKRYRTPYLLEQSNYSLELAKEDSKITQFLSQEMLQEIETAFSNVKFAYQDREVSLQESKNKNYFVGIKLQESKTWLSKAHKLAHAAQIMYHSDIPSELLYAGITHNSVPKTIDVLNQKIALTKKYKDKIVGATDEFVAQGEKLLSDLHEADRIQENERLVNLPKKLSDFYYNKGLLFFGLKLINNFGRAANADDKAAAEKYNLDILKRKLIRNNDESEESNTAQESTNSSEPQQSQTANS